MVAAARRRLARIILLLGVFLVLVRIWVSVQDMEQPSLAEAFPNGEMVVAVDASFPPFAVDDGQDLFGLDIDLARALGEEMGVSVRFVNMGYDGLYDALIDGHIDVVISALLVDPARMRDVLYTRPYFNDGLILVSNPDHTLTHMEDMPGYSVALEYGSPAHSEARYWLARVRPFTIRPYELPQYALDAVYIQEADAALVDTTTYMLYKREHSEWNAQSHRVTDALYAIAIRSDRDATFEWVDAALGSLQYDDRLAGIIARWL